MDEIACWNLLSKKKRVLFASLLKDKKEFEGFLSMVSAEYIHEGIPKLIKELYAGKICQHADLDMLIEQYPCGLAYALALIDTTDYRSITPGWVLYNYPEVEFIVKLLRHTACHEGCDYCHTQLDILYNLKYFSDMNVSEHTRVSHCKNERPKLRWKANRCWQYFLPVAVNHLLFNCLHLWRDVPCTDLRLSFLLCSL